MSLSCHVVVQLWQLSIGGRDFAGFCDLFRVLKLAKILIILEHMYIQRRESDAFSHSS